MLKHCSKIKAYYSAHKANAAHRKAIKNAHSGIRKTPDELLRIAQIIEPLIAKGQSLNHICATHIEELGISERTLYNYIDNSVFKIRNIDLPKKVVYRQRRPKYMLTKIEYQYRQGRSIEDFKSFIQANPDLSVVEMDTLKGARGKGKVLLTMIFRKTSFMLIFLLNDATQNSLIRSHLFFCDPQASWQKPHVENNHLLIRRILPKGTSFNSLSLGDVNLICCNINSVLRENLGNRSPFDLMDSADDKKLLSALGLSPIPPDEVILSPKLIKH